MLLVAACLTSRSAAFSKKFLLRSPPLLTMKREGGFPPASSVVLPSKVWNVRRKMIRGVVKMKEKQRVEGKESKGDGVKSSILVTTFIAFVGFTAVRFGGRAALMNLLGLDFIMDSGIKESVDSALAYFNSLGDLRFVYFYLAWMVAKLACIDYLSIALALSSGVLFDSLYWGTFNSVVGGTLASVVGFYLGRVYFKSFVDAQIQKSSLLRATAKTIARDGFKTVFALRLSPLLPLPLGAYNYLYGATAVGLQDFVLGTSLGSVKPMAFDAYLGLFGKSVIDQQGGANDAVLFSVIAVVILAGTFATQFVSNTITEIQNESAQEGTAAGSTEFFGLSDEAVPAMLLPLKRDLKAAWDRIGEVVEDETQASRLDMTEDTVVDPVDWNGDVLLPNAYPGPHRQPREFELCEPDASNVKEYSLESMLFSFALIGKFLS